MVEMKHIQIHVVGKVQGVFFRKSTKTTAEYLGIKGWVKNLPNGSVLIEAQGTDDALSKLIDWCKIGPTYARVDRVEVEEVLKSTSVFQSFEVK